MEKKMQSAMGVGISFILFFLASGPALAHFGMIIPSDQMVMQGETPLVRLELMFWHPFEGYGMDLDRPANFGVVANGRRKDMSAALRSHRKNKHQIWITHYRIKRPGVYIFYMEPQPYWEPAEDNFIVHYTKTYVAAYGDDEGWDDEIDLKTEIVPLSKPFGLYTGNIFQGIVKLDGKPVPFAEVEIEHYNETGTYRAPTDYMVTQTIKADRNGIFTYAAPWGGWWGFSALNKADFRLKHAGEEKEVELGAVIWVKFHKLSKNK